MEALALIATIIIIRGACRRTARALHTLAAERSR